MATLSPQHIMIRKTSKIMYININDKLSSTQKNSYLFFCQGSSDDDDNRFQPWLGLNIDFNIQLLGI